MWPSEPSTAAKLLPYLVNREKSLEISLSLLDFVTILQYTGT
jgi:hypothetical protein